jgi:hypothetical protein
LRCVRNRAKLSSIIGTYLYSCNIGMGSKWENGPAKNYSPQARITSHRDP